MKPSSILKSLFCTKECGSAKNIGTNVCPLPQEVIPNLVKLVTKEEVYHVVSSMKSYKAPEPDGY